MDASDPGSLFPQLASEAAVRQGAGQGQADHCHSDKQTGGHVEGKRERGEEKEWKRKEREGERDKEKGRGYRREREMRCIVPAG